MMIRRFFLYTLAALLMAPWMVWQAEAASTTDARQFADGLGQKVVKLLNGKGSTSEKNKQFERIFVENVDIPWMGQFALGAAWRNADAGQREQYIQAYHDYLVARYTSRFTDYNGSKYKITDVKDHGDGNFTVTMDVNTPQDKQQVAAGYRLRVEDNGQFKVTDIIIEGVSLITTQRDEFASVVQRDGIDGLISGLERKAREKKAGA